MKQVIKVTLEFEKVDEAIVALGKLVGTSGKAVAHAPKANVAGSVAPEVPTSQRRGRSDKGQPRGSYKDKPAPETPVVIPAAEPAVYTHVATPEGIVPLSPAAPDVFATSPAPTPVPETPVAAVPFTLEDLQAKTTKLVESFSVNVALAVLARFGVKRLIELNKDQYAGFVAKCDEVLAGGAV